MSRTRPVAAITCLLWLTAWCIAPASAENSLPDSGRVGVGTTAPASIFEVSSPAALYWIVNSHNWAGTESPAHAIMVTNPYPGGWDPVIIGRMATSTGSLKPAFALGAVGIGSWTDGSAATQLADIYLIGRDGSGTLQERMRIDFDGRMGIGTNRPRSQLEVSRASARFWDAASNSWNGTLEPAAAMTITNGTPGGWDPILLGKMTTSAGNRQPVFAIGAVGRSHWNDADASTQIADTYFLNRDASGNLKERMRISYQGRVGIGTTAPAALFHVAGDAQVDGNIAAKYQDIAEWVRTGERLPGGAVVVIDETQPNQVVLASRPYDTRVAGVVSERPGVLLGEAAADKAKVAHSGRVKVKVDARYGAVAIGDLLVTSPTAGHAMRSAPVDLAGTPVHRPGTLLGKALEPLAEGQGDILVLLMLQ